MVRGPDPAALAMAAIRTFHPPAGRFDGVIGGPPCQAFSQCNVMGRLGRQPLAENQISEFERIVTATAPGWFLMENIKQAPMPCVGGYIVKDLVLNNRHVGGEQNRIRRFSFGSPTGRPLLVEYAALDCIDYTPCVTVLTNLFFFFFFLARSGIADLGPCATAGGE